jgi:hypothetical protein
MNGIWMGMMYRPINLLIFTNDKASNSLVTAGKFSIFLFLLVIPLDQ